MCVFFIIIISHTYEENTCVRERRENNKVIDLCPIVRRVISPAEGGCMRVVEF